MPTPKIDPAAQACFDEVVAALGVGEGVKAKAGEVRLTEGGREGGRGRRTLSFEMMRTIRTCGKSGYMFTSHAVK